MLQQQLDELQFKHNELKVKYEELMTRHEEYKTAKEKEIRTLTDELAEKMEDLKIFNTEYMAFMNAGIKKNYFLVRAKQSDKLIRSFTGLDSLELFQLIFDMAKPVLSENPKMALSLQEQLLMTLMKFRMNLNFDFIAFCFGISQSTTETYFHTWIDVLYDRVAPEFVFWGERNELRLTMPMVFRSGLYRHVASMIDCFEIPVQKSKNLILQAASFSTYKGCNTNKYLISGTAQGSVNYISPSYGGKVSDKHIVQDCDYLQNLLPGDTVLADRGFLVAEDIGQFEAQLLIPAFKGKRSQIDGKETEDTRELANRRIHIERIIGSVRNFDILRGPVNRKFLYNTEVAPEDGRTLLDKIVFICCALHNLNPSIISLD
jgi:hypothetical protein